jgi:hypothetical protein
MGILHVHHSLRIRKILLRLHRNLSQLSSKKVLIKLSPKLFVYAGVPFNVLAQKELSEAVKIANPSAKLPTRQKAASTILHETFEEEKLEVFTKICQDTYYYTIQADAAKGNDGFPYLHHCLSSPVNGFLIDFMNCRSISKNAEFYAAQFTRVYELLPADIKMKVQAYVTDNCSTNQAAWAKIKAQHPPSHYCGVCVSRFPSSYSGY